MSSDELFFFGELSELSKSLLGQQINQCPKTEELGPLNPPSVLGRVTNGLCHIFDPNPAQCKSTKEKGWSSESHHCSSRPIANQTKKKEGRFEKPGNSEEHGNLTGTGELNRNSTGSSEFHHRSEEQGHHRSGGQGNQQGAQNLIIAHPLKSTLPQGRRLEIF